MLVPAIYKLQLSDNFSKIERILFGFTETENDAKIFVGRNPGYSWSMTEIDNADMAKILFIIVEDLD